MASGHERARTERLAWAVGAWTLLVPLVGTILLTGSVDVAFVATFGAVLLGGLVGKFVALPIVVGSLAWWALRSIVALVRGRPTPSFEHALHPTGRHAALMALVSTPLVLAAGALAGLVAGLFRGHSVALVAGFAGVSWLGLVGPSVAAAFGWLPAEAAFLVLLVAAFGDDEGGEPIGDEATNPPQPREPELLPEAARSRSNPSSTRSSPNTNSSA